MSNAAISDKKEINKKKILDTDANCTRLKCRKWVQDYIYYADIKRNLTGGKRCMLFFVFLFINRCDCYVTEIILERSKMIREYRKLRFYYL